MEIKERERERDKGKGRRRGRLQSPHKAQMAVPLEGHIDRFIPFLHPLTHAGEQNSLVAYSSFMAVTVAVKRRQRRRIVCELF